MTNRVKLSQFRIVMAAVLALVAMPACAENQREQVEAIIKEYLSSHPEEVQRIVKDYLTKNPNVLQEALAEMIKNRRTATTAANPDILAAIRGNNALLLNSKRQVTLGNQSGDVTLVEFFDYNCGFCKRALPDMLKLLKEDPKLKIVLKEYPILGPGSAEAARVAIAVRMQDPGGQKYLAFHQTLLGARGVANEKSALAAAQEAGLDMARLGRDMASDEVKESLAESVRLAQAIGIRGTPGYLIGETIVPGAIGATALMARIKEARK